MILICIQMGDNWNNDIECVRALFQLGVTEEVQ